ncbi:hypothetical protein NQ317_016845 [Molorchus minor]|uniref:DDE Tnp4 domain-containing protein n=1 Tax=Molorchus minor TaxID=1323400 RepID=A0ABQ9JKJ9_9CUCU|nr:hypothetical protein NQ317_016845 [Molorchus minor]
MPNMDDEMRNKSLEFYNIARFSRCIGALDCTYPYKDLFPVELSSKFENGYFGKYVLVGDRGYGNKRYLITPLGNPVLPEEQLFNESQIGTRNPVERTFGIWKRFLILAYGIRLKLKKVVVTATAVLHIIARMLNEEMPPINKALNEAMQYVNDVEIENIRDNIDATNNGVRYQLIHELL